MHLLKEEKRLEELPDSPQEPRWDRLFKGFCLLFEAVLVAVIAWSATMVKESTRTLAKFEQQEAEKTKTGDLSRQLYIDQQSKMIAQQKQLKDLLDGNIQKAEEVQKKLRGAE